MVIFPSCTSLSLHSRGNRQGYRQKELNSRIHLQGITFYFSPQRHPFQWDQSAPSPKHLEEDPLHLFFMAKNRKREVGVLLSPNSPKAKKVSANPENSPLQVHNNINSLLSIRVRFYISSRFD